jgi:heme-degrading monooxygenase HmoA
MTDQIVLINPFKVPENKLEESIKYWESHRDFMQKQPGYISTKLHQALQDQSFLGEATYQLINVAVWENQEAFNSAAQKMRTELAGVSVDGLTGSPGLYHIIRE